MPVECTSSLENVGSLPIFDCFFLCYCCFDTELPELFTCVRYELTSVMSNYLFLISFLQDKDRLSPSLNNFCIVPDSCVLNIRMFVKSFDGNYQSLGQKYVCS